MLTVEGEFGHGRGGLSFTMECEVAVGVGLVLTVVE